MEKLTKVAVARREINAAIRMFFQEEDPIAIHAVVAGGLQVVSDLAAQKGMTVGIESFIDVIIDEKKKKFRDHMRLPQNFLKHADKRDDENAVLEFRVESVEVYLTLAAQAYEEYTGRHTPETRIFMNWFLINNPELITDKEYLAQLATYKRDNDKELSTVDKSEFLKYLNKLRYERSLDESTIDYS